MPGDGIELQAFLVLDNSVLVMLHEYFCDRKARQLPQARLVSAVCQWMTDQLALLQQFTPDKRIHCTEGVAGEFKPSAGRLKLMPGMGPKECGQIAREVCSLLHQQNISEQQVMGLRNLPNAPKKLVGTDGLSDNDLSLVMLGLRLTAAGGPVYVLTNDRDLLDFVTWLRARPEARQRWPRLPALQSLQSLTYLDHIHRTCKIQTETMADLINFSIVEEFSRPGLSGTLKGAAIARQLVEANQHLYASTQIKLSLKGVAA